MAANLPVVVTSAGAQPTPPAALLAQLIALVSASNPGFTADLPGTLIEDVTSTQVGGLSLVDAARVETINSLSPYTANDYLLLQLGQQFIGPGAAPAVPTNTSVFVTFTVVDQNSNPIAGYPIPVGFVVSDGTYQYVVQDGGVTTSNGQTVPLFCQAAIPGSWGVPTGSVSQVVTSTPTTSVVIACSNPLPGIAGAAAETAAQFRARVIQAMRAVSTGTAALAKTLLGLVPGVQQRLVSVVQNVGNWTVIAGGGDPYLTAGAIWSAGLDVSTLVGATIQISNITAANPGVVTTSTNHNLDNGDVETLSGIVGMTPLNGVPITVTVLTEKTFSIGINTTGYPAYVSGGTVAPNPINVTADIYQYPDVYGVTFVDPPAQTVTMAVAYNTTQPNFTAQASIAQLAAPAIAAYVNSITVGNPISLIILKDTFVTAIAGILDPSLISSLTFSVSINGVPTTIVGQYYQSDPWSYFSATSAGIVVTQS